MRPRGITLSDAQLRGLESFTSRDSQLINFQGLHFERFSAHGASSFFFSTIFVYEASGASLQEILSSFERFSARKALGVSL